MVKRGKKVSKKTEKKEETEKTKSSEKSKPEKVKEKQEESKEEILEEKVLSFEEGINNQKFVEFLSPSTESVENITSRKPGMARSIERDELVLSSSFSEERKPDEGRGIYVPRGPDYNPLQTNMANVKSHAVKGSNESSMNSGRISSEFIRGENSISNTELDRINGKQEKDYVIKDEFLGEDIKYKPRRFR